MFSYYIIFRRTEMIILGDKIKMIRKELNLSQKELAKKICTQVTISKIEKHNRVPSITILSKICARLGVEIEHVCLSENNSNNTYNKFKVIENLCATSNHIKAYRTLISEFDEENLSAFELKEYLYYKGLTQLLGFNNKQEALSNLNMALLVNKYEQHSFMDVLVMHAIGITYLSDKDSGKAITYIEKSLENIEKIDKVTANYWNHLVKLYYNSAKFYSELKEYKKAIELCTKGIDLYGESKKCFYLDMLMYEKGFNLLKNKQKKEAEKHYFIAAGLGFVNNNKQLLTIIRKDSLEYKLALNYLDLKN